MVEPIINFLKNEDLKVKENWRIFEISETSAIDFMGYKFYSNRITIRKSILRRAKRKLQRFKENKNWYIASQLLSYKGWFSDTDTYKIQAKLNFPFIECQQIVSQHAWYLNFKESKKVK